MKRKYEFTNEIKELDDGIIVHRIRAIRNFGNVKNGDFGGFIEKDDNLSHKGNCWVYDNACVYNDAKIYGNSIICDNAKVYDSATIFGHSKICGNAKVFGNCIVYDYAMIYDDANVYGTAWIRDNAQIFNNARVYGNSLIGSSAKICDNMSIETGIFYRNKNIIQ